MIVGLPKKAFNYIQKNSRYRAGAYIGCKKSDGVIDMVANLYDKKKIKDKTIFLFEYRLNNDYTCKEELQKEIDGYIFICLKKQDGKFIKWTKKEMIGILTNKGEEL